MPARAGEGPSTPGTEPALALREQACREIRSRIVSCSYRPGMQLNEAMVAAKVGLGRTPIHQAVDRLRLEGLVAIHPRQGVEVRGFATRPVPGGSGTPPGIAASLGQPAGRVAPSCPTRMSQSLSARSPSRHRQEPHPMPSEHRMKRPRRLLARWALTLALVGGALAAPSPASAQTAPAPTAQAAPSPVRGGSMVIINGSDIRTWDPAITSGTFPGGPMDVLDAVYGFLVYVDVRGQVTGGMAESLTSADATTWTLKLREGVTFTDGTPYDAEAVKYNWERAADPATLAPTQTFMASWVRGIRVVDARTLTITLPSPNAHFAAQVAELSPFIASPTMLRAAREKTDIRPVGAGPFTLVSWNQGISMTMARNPGYWDQPRPYLDTLTFRIIPETNSRIATVVQGGATMMAGYLHQFGSNARARGVATVEVPIRGIYRAYFNHQRGIFTDRRAREAFYAAIDRARLMQAFTQTGGYRPPSNYFGSQSPYFDATTSLPAHDRARAQALFDALRAEGKPLEIRIVHATNSDLKRLGAYVQQVLGSFAGVTPVLVEVDQATLPQRCRTQMEFDICFEGGVIVANGPEPVASNLLSTGGPFNWGQYRSEAMDAALARARAAPDLAAARAAYAEVQRLMTTDLPFYLFGEESRFLLLRDNTGGVVPSNGGILQKQFLFVCPGPCAR